MNRSADKKNHLRLLIDGQLGFTLLEMALVMSIVGLMVGGGIMAVAPMFDKARITQTSANMDQVEAALVLFVMRNNRLPCPADGALTATSAMYGLEQTTLPTTTTPLVCSFATATATAQTPVLAHAVIPWRSLGLDETYSRDAWGQRLAYFPASPELFPSADSLVDVNCMVRNVYAGQTPERPNAFGNGVGKVVSDCDAGASTNGLTTFAPTSPVTTAYPPLAQDPATPYGVWPSMPFGSYIPVYAINTAQPTLLGNELTQSQPQPYPLTNTSASSLLTSSFLQSGQRAAYVLISHGKSGGCGWNMAGNQVPTSGGGCATTTQKLKGYNSAGTAAGFGFVQGTPIQKAGATNFDDILRWRSPSYIIQLCGSGACGNP